MSTVVSRYPAGRQVSKKTSRHLTLPPREAGQRGERHYTWRNRSLGSRVLGSYFAWLLVPEDSSKDLHALIQTCAESKVDHLCWSTGRPELESQLSVVVSQYRRLNSTTIVQAQTQCLLSRIEVITPQARDAASRREVAGRMERQILSCNGAERRANWMASLAGPGSARRGRCHTLI